MLSQKCKEEIAVIDSPCLQKYYDAREFCSINGKTNYSRLIGTFTLYCRLIFNCLDAVDRTHNFKTPARKLLENVPAGSDTPVSKRTRTISRLARSKTVTATAQKRPPSPIKQKNAKKAHISLICNSWIGDEAFCNFCDTKLIANTGSRIEMGLNKQSHLLQECTGIPGNGPMPLGNIFRQNLSKKLAQRLAEIAVSYTHLRAHET